MTFLEIVGLIVLVFFGLIILFLIIAVILVAYSDAKYPYKEQDDDWY